MHQRALATDFDSWCDLVSGSFVPLGTERVRRPGPWGFRGTVDTRRLGEIALTELDEAVGARLMHNAVDLLTTVVTDALGAGPTSAPARGLRRAPGAPSGIPVLTSAPAAGQHDQQRERQRQQVREYIDAHLDDPALAPAAVARAMFMSVRSLHLLFEGTGTTVAALIRDRRLEHCRTELEDTVHTERPVAVVGARWGLTDPAHFSRVFRARYGVSPGQYRRRAAAA